MEILQRAGWDYYEYLFVGVGCVVARGRPPSFLVLLRGALCLCTNSVRVREREGTGRVRVCFTFWQRGPREGACAPGLRERVGLRVDPFRPALFPLGLYGVCVRVPFFVYP